MATAYNKVYPLRFACLSGNFATQNFRYTCSVIQNSKLDQNAKFQSLIYFGNSTIGSSILSFYVTTHGVGNLPVKISKKIQKIKNLPIIF